jgi:ankyrin repeat protein
LPQTEELCKRLIHGGADINQLDERGRVPLQYLIIMKYTDEELELLYKIWLAQSTLFVNHKNVWGKRPLDIAEQMPYRKSFVERLKKYE